MTKDPIKKQPSASRHQRPGRGNGNDGVEWVGGRLTSPFYIYEPTPFRPEIILWIEQPGDLVVGFQVIDPSGPRISFAESLEQAMRAPVAGRPRRPGRIRVPEAQLAAELRQTVPEVEVVVAPAPELEDVLRMMEENMPGDEEHGSSYLEPGRIPAGVIEALFAAARNLYVVAPWKRAADSQVLRMDIPALGVEGACVSIIGALGESLGLIIFPSLTAYEDFRVAAEDTRARGDMPDLGTSMLSLNFERGADLPARMRREAAEHGWPVADPNAYPYVHHLDRDGLLRPLTEQDVRIVTACAASLAAFCIKHAELFEQERFEPICESWFDDDDLEVRFTVPYEAGDLFAIDDPAPAPIKREPKVGRNSPCPCGSGRKYKKCCLRREQAGQDARSAPAKVHEVDQRLISQMLDFAGRRFGEPRPGKAFSDPEAETALLLPWLAYHVPIEGRPPVQWFTEEHGRALSRTEARWLEAQQAAWLSVWEISAVQPGRSLTLEDLLTGEKRQVSEVSASQTLSRRDAILARVVDWNETSLICGCHSRPLPPVEAAEVVRRVRSRLRRKRAIPVERLRDEKTGRWMIQRWEEAVGESDARSNLRPSLTNTDGEPLLLTVDRFEFEPARREEVEQRLAALPRVEAPAPDEADRSFVFLRGDETSKSAGTNTVIGRAQITKGSLRLETNSVQRADALRRQLEEACGALLRHRGRDHTDPLVAAKSAEAGDPAPNAGGSGDLPPAEAAALIRQFKTQHYGDWPNEPLPALGGKTPRQSVKTKAGRAAVDVLLKDMERHESRLPEDEQFDFTPLRRELGLD